MTSRTTARKATNLSLDPALLAEARALGVNLSQAAEAGLRLAIANAWREEKAEAIASSNAWVEENGLPLDGYRQF